MTHSCCGNRAMKKSEYYCCGETPVKKEAADTTRCCGKSIGKAARYNPTKGEKCCANDEIGNRK